MFGKLWSHGSLIFPELKKIRLSSVRSRSFRHRSDLDLSVLIVILRSKRKTISWSLRFCPQKSWWDKIRWKLEREIGEISSLLWQENQFKRKVKRSRPRKFKMLTLVLYWNQRTKSQKYFSRYLFVTRKSSRFPLANYVIREVLLSQTLVEYKSPGEIPVKPRFVAVVETGE